MRQIADAGRMIDVLVVEQRSTSVAPDGTEVEVWHERAAIRGEPMTITDQEAQQGRLRTDGFVRRWRIWWMPELTLRDRIRDSLGRIYYVRRIDDPTGRQREMIVTCEDVLP